MPQIHVLRRPIPRTHQMLLRLIQLRLTRAPLLLKRRLHHGQTPPIQLTQTYFSQACIPTVVVFLLGIF